MSRLSSARFFIADCLLGLGLWAMFVALFIFAELGVAW